jgi:hypothetical protein
LRTRCAMFPVSDKLSPKTMILVNAGADCAESCASDVTRSVTKQRRANFSAEIMRWVTRMQFIDHNSVIPSEARNLACARTFPQNKSSLIYCEVLRFAQDDKLATFKALRSIPKIFCNQRHRGWRRSTLPAAYQRMLQENGCDRAARHSRKPFRPTGSIRSRR